MSTNKTALESLLSGTDKIMLPDSGVELECRALPFTTFVFVLTQAASAIRAAFTNPAYFAKATDAVKDIFRSAAARLAAREAAARGEQVAPVDADDALGVGLSVLLPLLQTFVAHAPDVLNRILEDVIVGEDDIPKRIAGMLSVTDSLFVLNHAIKALNPDVVAEEVVSLFFATRTLIDRTKAFHRGVKTPTETSSSS